MDIITRKQALEQGLTHYFTGKPCKYGHIAQRSTKRPECQECYRLRNITPKPAPRVCDQCSALFVPTINARRSRFCSSECHQSFWRKWKTSEAGRRNARKLYQQNGERIRARRQAWYQENKDGERQRSRAFYEANKESERLRAQRFFAANPTYRLEYERRRYQQDEQWRIRKILRSRLYAIVRRGMGKKLGNTLELLGCTLDEFKFHIEGLWQEGMSWENHGHTGNVWHIDHIRPCASFDLTDPDQQRQCFHWSNLQPLWGIDNIRKGAKLLT